MQGELNKLTALVVLFVTRQLHIQLWSASYHYNITYGLCEVCSICCMCYAAFLSCMFGAQCLGKGLGYKCLVPTSSRVCSGSIQLLIDILSGRISLCYNKGPGINASENCGEKVPLTRSRCDSDEGIIHQQMQQGVSRRDNKRAKTFSVQQRGELADEEMRSETEIMIDPQGTDSIIDANAETGAMHTGTPLEKYDQETIVYDVFFPMLWTFLLLYICVAPPFEVCLTAAAGLCCVTMEEHAKTIYNCGKISVVLSDNLFYKRRVLRALLLNPLVQVSICISIANISAIVCLVSSHTQALVNMSAVQFCVHGVLPLVVTISVALVSKPRCDVQFFCNNLGNISAWSIIPGVLKAAAQWDSGTLESIAVQAASANNISVMAYIASIFLAVSFVFASTRTIVSSKAGDLSAILLLVVGVEMLVYKQQQDNAPIICGIALSVCSIVLTSLRQTVCLPVLTRHAI